MKIEIEVPDGEIERFGKYMGYKKMCGDLNPNSNPADKVLVAVMSALVSGMNQYVAATDEEANYS